MSLKVGVPPEKENCFEGCSKKQKFEKHWYRVMYRAI